MLGEKSPSSDFDVHVPNFVKVLYEPSFTIMYQNRTLFDKRQKRKEAKKRKIKAFLDLARSNEVDRKRLRDICSAEAIRTSLISKDTGGDLSKIETKSVSLHEIKTSNSQQDSPNEDTVLALKAAVREHRKKKEPRPQFYLEGPGLKARFPLQDTIGSVALCVQDLQHLLLAATIGQSSSYRIRWCRLQRHQKLSHIVFLTVEGIFPCDFKALEFSHLKELFNNNVVEFVSPSTYDSSFLAELLSIPLGITSSRNILASSPNNGPVLKPLRIMFPITPSQNVIPKDIKDTFPRTHLLLSLPQLLMEGYPMPAGDQPETQDYCFTKLMYTDVSDSSPIFAVDCEMCLTSEKQHELTRISVVNEKLEVLYNTLVKPKNQITNYLTKFSGITENMLDDVSTRLEDVQEQITDLLPEDAILCGQSLNYDLHALKMMHPYVIDTSVIYNITGNRTKKTSLKLLSHLFLNKSVQCSGEGHDSVEDSGAAMELVQLKLSKDLSFGDVLLGGEVPLPVGDNKQMENTAAGEPTVQDFAKATSLLHNIKESGKSLCIIGTLEKISEYTNGSNANIFQQMLGSDFSDIVQKTIENAISHNVTFSHLPVKWQSFSQVCSAIQEIYSACADKALFVVAFMNPLSNGVCMVKIKGSL